MLAINTNLPLPVTKALSEALAKLVKNIDSNYVTLNFRDPNYSAEAGGYRPVEINLVLHQQQWHINYITEFTYMGIGYFAELAKALDFDFGSNLFQTIFGVYGIEAGREIYPTWEQNFLCYWQELDVFQITVTTE